MELFSKNHINPLIKILAVADIAFAIMYFLSGFVMMYNIHGSIPGKITYLIGYEVLGLFCFAFLYILLAVFHKIINR